MLHREEAHNVDGLGEHLEEGDLSKGSWGDTLLIHLQTGLLQGNQLPSGLLLGLVHLPICAFSNLLQLLVLVHSVSIAFSYHLYTVDHI